MSRILYPEWRRQNETTAYPFSTRATLRNSTGRIIVEGCFLDASLYPVGGQSGLYLSKAEITHQTVTLTIGDSRTANLATGTFAVANPGSVVAFVDAYDRPAGTIISEPNRLGILTAWGVGTHEFLPTQSEFCPTVCIPTPEIGVRGIVLEDGSIFVGDVWLIGDDGVVLRTENVMLPGNCGQAPRNVSAIRVDIVGDPLFRRRLCQPSELFSTPRFVKTVRFVADNMTVACVPNERGELVIAGNNDLASDTVLRIVPTASGLKVGAVGSILRRT